MARRKAWTAVEVAGCVLDAGRAIVIRSVCSVGAKSVHRACKPRGDVMVASSSLKRGVMITQGPDSEIGA
jgi:hypothetical protein